MDLKQSFQTAIDEIETRKAGLDIREAELIRKEKQLIADQKEFDEKKQELDTKIKELGGVEKAHEIKEQYERKMSEADKRINVASAKKAELITWENKLYTIQTRQTNKDKELAEREVKLNHEKETYKEDLKVKFVEALKQYLPQ